RRQQRRLTLPGRGLPKENDSRTNGSSRCKRARLRVTYRYSTLPRFRPEFVLPSDPPSNRPRSDYPQMEWQTMSSPKSVRVVAVCLPAPGPGWFAYRSPAGPQPATPGTQTGAVEQGDTKPAPRRAWDSARDLPPPIAADGSVKYDYPIVYVRVPRPYPKAYS